MSTNTADYSRLLSVRDRLFPSFHADQAAAARALCDLVAEEAQAGEIKRVVDLGCGTGETLGTVARELGERFGHTVTGVGVDPCGVAIANAQSVWVGCSFFNTTAEQYLRLLAETCPRPCNQNAFVCVGHTIPHMQNVAAFLSDLAALEPATIILDFHAGWDETLHDLGTCPQQPVVMTRRCGALGDGHSASLITRRDGHRSDRVDRGVEMKDATGHLMFEFWTNQAAFPTAWYEEKLAKLGYQLSARASYTAGYGPMCAFKFRRAK